MENQFNFYALLQERGYEKETIRDGSGKTFCTVYQKEIEENTWNALTVHQDKTFTASSISGNLEFKERLQPTSLEEANIIFETIEKK